MPVDLVNGREQLLEIKASSSSFLALWDNNCPAEPSSGLTDNYRRPWWEGRKSDAVESPKTQSLVLGGLSVWEHPQMAATMVMMTLPYHLPLVIPA